MTYRLLFFAALCVSAPRLSAALAFAFLYGWYGTLDHDGAWSHWNHSVLPHWTAAVRERYPEGAFVAPNDIHAPFYPARGLYSSRNASVLREQLLDLREHGVGAAIVSWWGRPGASEGDSQGATAASDAFVAAAFAVAAELGGIHIALHLEPYPGRDVASIRADIDYLLARHGASPAWLRLRGKSLSGGAASPPPRPVYFVYDSYHIPASAWRALLRPAGGGGGGAAGVSLRGSPSDGLFIGLWLDSHHGQELADGGFDGAFTYFAVDGFSFGSSSSNWRDMGAAAARAGLLFIPCVDRKSVV